MRIIPAIDIIDGKCVRLTKGDYATQKIYNEDPLEVAKAFEGSGVTSAFGGFRRCKGQEHRQPQSVGKTGNSYGT